VATEADEGRLYARVTDVGLADELGCGRDTVKNAAQRLAGKELIRICELPDDFRDSKGQFSGTKAFLISGIPSNYVSKAITQGNGGGTHRDGLSSTGDKVETHRAGLSSTIQGSREYRAGLTVTADPAHRAGLSGTNEEEEEAEEEDDIISSLLDRFASRRNDPAYRACAREREQVRELLDEGYSADQIAGAIDQVFHSRPPDANPVRSFGFVLPYVHRRLRPIRRPSTEAGPTEATVGRNTSAPIGDRLTGTTVTDVPSAADAARMPQPADDPMAPVYSLLEAASVRGMEGVEDVVYSIPGIQLGLRHLLEMPEPFSPGEIHGAVLAAVSRNVPPDRLVGYAQAVLENARRDAREQERLQRSLSAARLTGLGDVSTVSGGYPASSREAESPSALGGPDKEARALRQAALSELELQMTRATFDAWIRPTELLAWEPVESDDSVNGSTRVVLGTPNEYVKDWLENRLYTPVVRTLSGIAGHPVEVEFEIHELFTGQDQPVLNAL